MPDISMCNNKTCPLSNKCYRHRAIPNPDRQSYSDFTWTKSKGCDHYIMILDNDKIRPIS